MRRIVRIVHVSAGALLLAASLATAEAASVLDDPFQLDGFVSGSAIVGATGIAGQRIPGTGDDITASAGDFTVHLSWFDADSFDVQLITETGGFLGAATLTLSDLDFRMLGVGVDIVGATFNPDANGYTGYFVSPDNPSAPSRPGDPLVTWTAHSVTVDYGADWSPLTVADQVTLRFDVQTAAVPEPGTLAFAGAALVAGIALRRKVRRD